MLGRQDVDQRRGERRRRVARLLDESHDAVVRRRCRDPVVRGELEVADVVERHGAGRLRLRAPPRRRSAAARTRTGCRRRGRAARRRAAASSITSRRSPTAPSRSSFDVVPSSWTVTRVLAAQRREGGAKRLFVTRWTPSTSSTSRDAVEHPVEHRPPADRQQVLRHVVRQRPQAGRVARGEDHDLHREGLRVRRTVDAVLGDDRRDQRRRRDVEGGIAGREAARQLGRVALLDRDPGAVRSRAVERRRRRDDVERDLVVRGEHGERVCPDLVRRVAVSGDPVGAGDDEVDLAARHERAGGGVGDDGVRDPDPLELPRGEARALEERPRLVDENALEQPALGCGAERADRGAVAAGGEAAGVAVRERARPGLEELGGVRGHPPAALDLLVVERARPLGRRVIAHLGERPRKVDRGRPRGSREPARPRRGPRRAARRARARTRPRCRSQARRARPCPGSRRPPPQRVAQRTSTTSSGSGAGRGGRPRGRPPRTGRSARGQVPSSHEAR